MNRWEQWCQGLADAGTVIGYELVGRTHCTSSWGIDSRRLDEHLIYFPLRGEIDASIEGRGLVIPPWSVLWLPPGTEHSFRHRDLQRLVTLHHWRFTCDLPVPIDGWLLALQAQELEVYAARFHDAYHHEPRLREQRMRLLLATFFNALADLARGREHGDGLDQSQRERLLDWVDRHIRHDPAPSDLAAALGLSPAWFARRFKRSFGCSPRGWLKQQRIRAAATMLEESEAEVGAIADELGYSDIFNFSKQFKAVMGMSPSAYRRQVNAVPTSKGR